MGDVRVLRADKRVIEAAGERTEPVAAPAAEEEEEQRIIVDGSRASASTGTSSSSSAQAASSSAQAASSSTAQAAQETPQQSPQAMPDDDDDMEIFEAQVDDDVDADLLPAGSSVPVATRREATSIYEMFLTHGAEPASARKAIAEIFSPPRVTAQLDLMPKLKLHLMKGSTFDLRCDRNGRRWNFLQEQDRQEAREMIRREKAYVLIGAPLCPEAAKRSKEEAAVRPAGPRDGRNMPPLRCCVRGCVRRSHFGLPRAGIQELQEEPHDAKCVLFRAR